MNVYLKSTVAGATWPRRGGPFRRTTPGGRGIGSGVGNRAADQQFGHGARRSAAEIRDQVRKGPGGSPGDRGGKGHLAGMETARFIPALDKDYDVVRAYVERFETDVRKVATHEDRGCS